MDKFKIELTSESSDSQECTINIEGDLGISNIEKIKRALMEHIADFEKIKIIVRNVLFIDLSFLQLLYSLELSQDTLEKEIKTDIHADTEFNELIIKTGFKLKYGYE